MPAISGPSITCSGRPPSAEMRCQQASVSSVMKSVMPCTRAWLRRSSTVALRQARRRLSSLAAPFTFSAISSNRSVLSARRFSTTSSTRSRNSAGMSSYTPTMPALTMPMSSPAWMAWYRNTVWMASRTGSLPRKLKLTLDTPPDTLAPGRLALIQRVALMKSTA